jgi:hypothetical protein
VSVVVPQTFRDRIVKTTTELPEDPGLPALLAIRTAGLARTFPALGLDDHAVELSLCGYTRGKRATIDARVGHRHFAVKAYAEDSASEAALYEALASAGLASESGVRVPPLLAWERDLRVLVIGWLEGPTAEQLLRDGQGARAGELAACWLQRAVSLTIKLGHPFGAARMLHRARKWATALGEADSALGLAAAALMKTLSRTQPNEHTARLVHGTLYARHILDAGDGPGVIDWQRFGQGPLELDAGMFLATIFRLGLLNKHLASEAARAEEAFQAGTDGLMDERALAWHCAAALLRLTEKLVVHRRDEWPVRAQALLAKAERHAETAG